MIEVDSEQTVRYAAPATVSEVLALLEGNDDARLVAGGQSLFVFLRQGLLQPSLLVGLKGVDELIQFDEVDDGGLVIGAMVTQQTLANSPLVRDRYPALGDAASVVASPLIRRQGTIGGNLCHADPTADTPAALIALGAEIEVASAAGRRRMPVETLFADYMETVLGRDEILVAIYLPPSAPRSGSAYQKHRVRGVDTALVGAAVAVTLDAEKAAFEAVRIGLAGAGTTPIRAAAAEEVLNGAPATGEVIEAAAQAAAAECEPLADSEGSEWYRREMATVFVRRAAERALERAWGVK